jgi:hypothetical protein
VVGEVDFETDSWCGDREDVVGEDGCGAGGGRRGAEEGVEPSSERRKIIGSRGVARQGRLAMGMILSTWVRHISDLMF